MRHDCLKCYNEGNVLEREVMKMEVVRLSENAMLFRGGRILNRLRPFPGLIEVVPAYDSFAVFFDLAVCTADQVKEEVALQVAEMVGERSLEEGKIVDIEVVYDGPDLAEVAQLIGLTVEEVIALHSGQVYEVVTVGFVPGFPFLRGLPERLAIPRRAEPRKVVPAGSVGIAGGQTGIYPSATPGGWHLIGRTDARLYDAGREAPSLLVAGDRVRFVPVAAVGGARR
jgi:inhibitor of KinA